MDKKVPGVRKSYDILSEIVHPNWRGVFGMCKGGFVRAP
jgi:hypothetical protein